MVETAPTSWSAAEIARRVRRREVSAAEVVEAHLERTAEVEPELHAYLELFDESARRRAADLDRRLAAGDAPGPLAGVPVAVKDNLALEGERLTCGSRVLEGYTAPYTATAVARLVAAGAVVLGKTNLDEFAMGSSTETSAFGPTRNPHDRERVPGGSSGGSAAAVAARSVPLALGSDSGGSVRQPAAFCGVVGLRPTWGRVSRHGLVAFASSLDQVGPLARSVEDAALALGVIAGADPRDATTAEEPVEVAVPEGPVEGRRIGVLRQVDGMELSAAARRAWAGSLRRLGELGCELVEVSVPEVTAAVAVYQLLATAEASTNLARFDGVRYGRRAAGTEAGGFSELVRRSRSQGFGAEVTRRVLLGTFALSAGHQERYYQRARRAAARLRRGFETALDEVAWIVHPTTAGVAFRLGARSADPLAMYLSDQLTAPASLAGLPAVAVPCGEDGAGLPLSLQIVGRRFDEAGVLGLARRFVQD